MKKDKSKKEKIIEQAAELLADLFISRIDEKYRKDKSSHKPKDQKYEKK